MKGRSYRVTNDVLLPSGHGLSYTTFEFGKASVSRTTISSDETLELTVPVSNAGRRDGAEVVQVYVRKVGDEGGPLKTLRGFARVEIAAGSKRQAQISLPPEAFAFYDDAQRAMAVVPGGYEILYGNSTDARSLRSMSVSIRQ